MTDAHCHISSGDRSVRELICFEPDSFPPEPPRDSFVGIHPWTVLAHPDDRAFAEAALANVESLLASNQSLGVGEIGLDRLKVRDIPDLMRTVFERQLDLAASLRRPVVLHGAKAWGQVVRAIASRAPSARPPSCLFHGFSRSDGLIPEIVRLNGFISVGPSILNDHAVNYRKMAAEIPQDRLLVETDRDGTEPTSDVGIGDILAKLAEIRGLAVGELVAIADRNAGRFLLQ